MAISCSAKAIQSKYFLDKLRSSINNMSRMTPISHYSERYRHKVSPAKCQQNAHHNAFIASSSGIVHSCLSVWARTAFDGFWRTERIRPSEERHPSLFGRWSAGSRVSSKSQPSTKAAVQRMPGSTWTEQASPRVRWQILGR